MKKKIYFLILLLLANHAIAQTVQRNLLRRFTPEKIAGALIPKQQWKPFPQTPHEWRQQLPDSIIQQLISNGEANLQTPFASLPATVTLEYVRTGNRSNYEAISFGKRIQLWQLVLAETVEGKGRFVEQIMNGVWSICEESFWGVPAHIHYQKEGKGLPDKQDPIVDLFVAETATLMAVTDHLTGEALDKISPLIRRRIYDEVNKRMFIPMQTANYPWLGLGLPDKILNNWAPWVMSNYIAASLLLEKDDARRAQSLYYSFQVIDHYINGLGKDGSVEEGPSYFFSGAGAIFDALDLAIDASAGKLNIYEDPFLQKISAYIYKMHIAGKYFVNMGDADPTVTPDGLMLYRLGKAVGDSTMMQFGTWAHQAYGINISTRFHLIRMLYNFKTIKDAAMRPPVEFKGNRLAWLSDIQVMTARSDNGFFVASHGGHNAEGHNHNDVGDFIIYFGGNPVIIDVGRGTYTYRIFHKERYNLWFNNSGYHNLPIINGFTQLNGRQYEATNVTCPSSELKMDIGKAYPAEAGIISWERSVRLLKEGRVQVSDSYRMHAPLKSLTQSFMTVCNVTVEKPGKAVFTMADGKAVFMQYDEKQWELKKEKMALTEPEDEIFKTSWGNRDIWRILLVSKIINATGKVTYTFSR